MKIVTSLSRYLLGLLFTVMGLNGFLHFIPMAPVPPLAGQFLGALVASHYMAVVFAFQIAGGLLLLATSYVPLALALLAPIVFNIDLFHAFMEPAGMPPAILVSLLWLVVAYSVRPAFAGIWKSVPPAHAQPQSANLPPRTGIAGLNA